MNTGSSGEVISDLVTFTVDHGDGLFNMHVITGENVIVYDFYKCIHNEQNGICDKLVISESGTVTIEVNYSEKTLAGTMTIDDCVPPTPTPTPSP